MDTTPLRTSRGFRWLFLGQLGGQLSRQMLVVAVPYQVYILTESSLIVGMIGLTQIGPLILFSIIGGAAADTFDRRRILGVVQLGLAASTVGLAFNGGAGASLWPIFALIAFNSAATGFEAPVRPAIIPSLVPREQLPSAFALNATLHQTAQVAGPALAGVLISVLGVTGAYWLSTVGFLLTALALIPLGPRPPQGAKAQVSVAAIAEGWRYLRRRPLLQQLMLIDLNAMVFGMPRALFPVIGLVTLGGDAATVGLLHAAPGVGSLVGAVTTGWISAIRRQGRVVVIAVCIFGAAIAGFGLAQSLPLALAFLAIAGAADIVSNVFRNTILQLAVPDSLRGRITAVKHALSGGGPHLGDAESGAVAEITNPTISVVSGGLLTIAGTMFIAWRQRALWDQTTVEEQSSRPDETAA